MDKVGIGEAMIAGSEEDRWFHTLRPETSDDEEPTIVEASAIRMEEVAAGRNVEVDVAMDNTSASDGVETSAIVPVCRREPAKIETCGEKEEGRNGDEGDNKTKDEHMCFPTPDSATSVVAP